MATGRGMTATASTRIEFAVRNVDSSSVRIDTETFPAPGGGICGPGVSIHNVIIEAFDVEFAGQITKQPSIEATA